MVWEQSGRLARAEAWEWVSERVWAQGGVLDGRRVRGVVLAWVLDGVRE